MFQIFSNAFQLSQAKSNLRLTRKTLIQLILLQNCVDCLFPIGEIYENLIMLRPLRSQCWQDLINTLKPPQFVLFQSCAIVTPGPEVANKAFAQSPSCWARSLTQVAPIPEQTKFTVSFSTSETTSIHKKHLDSIQEAGRDIFILGSWLKKIF